MSEMTDDEIQEIDAIMTLDCTWYQAKGFIRDIPDDECFIMLNDYKTIFWRYQPHSDNFLATVESAYYFYKEYMEQMKLREVIDFDENDWNLDDLLYFYCVKIMLIVNSERTGGRKVSYIQPQSLIPLGREEE